MIFLRLFDNREAARAARRAAEGRSRLVSFVTTILRLRPPFRVCETGEIVHARVHSTGFCDSQTPKTLPTDPLPPARFRVATARGHLPTLHWPRPDNEGEARSSLAGGRSQVFGFERQIFPMQVQRLIIRARLCLVSAIVPAGRNQTDTELKA